MKITWREVRELEDFIQRLEDDEEKRCVARNHLFAGEPFPWAFFAERPHLLMPLGFDEYVAFANRSQFADYWFAHDVEDTGQSLYRRPGGQWLLLFGAPESRRGDFLFHSKRTIRDDDKEDVGAFSVALSNLFERLYEIADDWLEDDHMLWSPRLWTPDAQQREKITLVNGARNLLTALAAERIHLNDVTWQQLEEIVAEVLRAHGLEIHVVRERPQGGRDIIARGELIPGEEPLTMAVEVKHRDIVDRPEVQAALWQNRRLPALMFVTSGRFTAGVFQEKSLPENRLRLYLKDGVALGDMVANYRTAMVT